MKREGWPKDIRAEVNGVWRPTEWGYVLKEKDWISNGSFALKRDVCPASLLRRAREAHKWPKICSVDEVKSRLPETVPATFWFSLRYDYNRGDWGIGLVYKSKEGGFWQAFEAPRIIYFKRYIPFFELRICRVYGERVVKGAVTPAVIMSGPRYVGLLMPLKEKYFVDEVRRASEEERSEI